MATLKNYPLVSQLTGIVPNIDPHRNGGYDCVEASVGSALLYYMGLTQWTEEINPDAIKIAAYGIDYTGGTSAARLIPYCEKLGYKLYSVQGDNVRLVQLAHEYIQAGKPVIFTQPDTYSSNPGFSHVEAFFSERPGYLTSLDPYIARPVERPDQTWESLLWFGEIWIVEPLHPVSHGDSELPMLQLTDPMGKYFVQVASTRWHCPQTNNDIAYAHLDFYRKYEGIFGLPRTGEIYLAQFPGTAIQVYERGIAAYDPDDKIPHEKPPGAGTVYLLHIDSGTGQQIIAKPLLVELQTQVTSMQGQVKNLQGQITLLEEQNASLSDTSALQTKLASYETAIRTIIDALLPIEHQA